MRDVLITYNDFARFPELRFVPELRRLTTRCLTARKLWRYQKALHHGLRPAVRCNKKRTAPTGKPADAVRFCLQRGNASDKSLLNGTKK